MSSFLLFYIWLVYVHSIDTYIWAMSVENKSSFLMAFTRAVELSCIQFEFSWVQFSSVGFMFFSSTLCILFFNYSIPNTLAMGFCFHLTANSRLYSRIIFHFILSFVCLLLLGILFFPVAIFLFHLVFIYVVLFSIHFSKNFGLFCLWFFFCCCFFDQSFFSRCVFVSFGWWKCNFQLINTFLFWKIILGNTLLVSFPAKLSICCYQTGPNLVAGGLTVLQLVSWLFFFLSFSYFPSVFLSFFFLTFSGLCAFDKRSVVE